MGTRNHTQPLPMEQHALEKNLFLLPTREAGKSFINEMTRMINAWFYDIPIKDITLSKDHPKLLERRFEIWKDGNINELYEEGKAIQNRLKSRASQNNKMKISKNF